MKDIVDCPLAAFDLVVVEEYGDLREDVARILLHKEFAVELGIAENVPGGCFLVGDVFRIIDDAHGAPHIAHGIVVGVLAAALELVEAGDDEGGDILLDVVGSLSEVVADRKQEVLAEHTLNDVIGRAHDVEIFLPLLDFREHRLVDVESLVDYVDGLSRLFLIPLLEFLDCRHIHIVGPVVDLQDVFAVSGAAADHCRGGN